MRNLSGTKIDNMTRDTGHICPNCREGTILDKRALSRSEAFWICSNSIDKCRYTEISQWLSREWEVPYFIEISESQTKKREREEYEESIGENQVYEEQQNEIHRENMNKTLICRECGKRNCKKINNCLY